MYIYLSLFLSLCIYIYMYMYTCVYIYIYIYIYNTLLRKDTSTDKRIPFLRVQPCEGWGPFVCHSGARAHRLPGVLPPLPVRTAARENICMYVYIYIYTYIHVYIYIYIHMYICIYVDMCECMYI